MQGVFEMNSPPARTSSRMRRSRAGMWAKHWYHSVEQSTGFSPERERKTTLTEHLAELYRECMPYYEALHAHRLSA